MDLTKKFTIVCGHYGCGKSNFSINLALAKAKLGRKVMLLDLDLVNPYFLSSGYKMMLEEKGVKVVAPLYANTNVDIPALPAAMYSIFETDADVVMDVGGDDAGSTVLGRFHEQLHNIDYDMLYVINHYRNLTATPEDTAEILYEIEKASRCKATAIVNNSHLKYETTWDTVSDAIEYAKRTAELLQLPITATTIPTYLQKDDRVQNHMKDMAECNWYPVEIIVRAPWEYEAKAE